MTAGITSKPASYAPGWARTDAHDRADERIDAQWQEIINAAKAAIEDTASTADSLCLIESALHEIDHEVINYPRHVRVTQEGN